MSAQPCSPELPQGSSAEHCGDVGALLSASELGHAESDQISLHDASENNE